LVLELGVTFVEVLWPVLARRSNTIVDGRNLERGATLTRYHERQRTEEFDRERISTFGRVQYIVDKGMFLIRSEILCLAALSIREGLP
jgi:hypothetical protein